MNTKITTWFNRYIEILGAKMKIVLLVMCSILILFSYCKRKPKEDEILKLPQELKDYVMYPVGSFWVYQDSVSGVKDSMVLTYQHVFEKDWSHTLGVYSERLDQNFQSSKNGFYGVGGRIEQASPILFYYTNGISIFYAPLSNLKPSALSITSIDSLRIYSNVFLNIRVLGNNNSSGGRSYWAAGVGLIKYQNDTDTTVLLLTNYHINN